MYVFLIEIYRLIEDSFKLVQKCYLRLLVLQLLALSYFIGVHLKTKFLHYFLFSRLTLFPKVVHELSIFYTLWDPILGHELLQVKSKYNLLS
jgi:hypothetical protein